MWWKIVIILAGGMVPGWCGTPSNCSSRNVDIFGGVCKADYGSRFNIDSKELGTTCVTKNRGGAIGTKPLAVRLKLAIDKMKKDFQQLQELIDEEVPYADEPAASMWRGSSLSVHREYPPKKKVDKMGGFSDTPSEESRLNIDSVNGESLHGNQPMFKSPQTNLFGSRPDSFPYGETVKSKNINDNVRLPPNQFRSPLIRESLNLNRDELGREARGEVSPEAEVRQPFSQQRILADIRLDPDLTENGQDMKAEFAEPRDSAQPPADENPSNVPAF